MLEHLQDLLVAFREVGESTGAFKFLTMALILLGVGTLFYTLTVALETLVEGRVTDHLRRRRMSRDISRMSDHVIVCAGGELPTPLLRAIGIVFETKFGRA